MIAVRKSERDKEKDGRGITRVRGWLDGTTVGNNCRAADFLVAITAGVYTSLRLALGIALYINDRNKFRR